MTRRKTDTAQTVSARLYDDELEALMRWAPPPTDGRCTRSVILTAEEIDRLGHDACRRVAEAMQRVADAHGIDADIRHERVSGKRRGEDEVVWEHLAITLADEVVEEIGL